MRSRRSRQQAVQEQSCLTPPLHHDQWICRLLESVGPPADEVTVPGIGDRLDSEGSVSAR